MNKSVNTLALLFFVLISCSTPRQQKIDLSGQWKFAMDREDKGIAEAWFTKSLDETVVLPGSMNLNGKGEEVNLQTKWTGQVVDSSFFKLAAYEKFRKADNFKIPFWLQPLHHYQGAAWYQKEVNIPGDWEDQEINLILERCHWESRLWIDDQEIGMCNSLGTPHRYSLTGKIKPGKHTLSLRIDNRIKDSDPGINSHSISDHTQTNWNGIVGELALVARPMLNIESLEIYPDIRKKSIEVLVLLYNANDTPVHATLVLSAAGASNPASISENLELISGENPVRLAYPMGDDVRLWDEFSPNLYTLSAVLQQEGRDGIDSISSTFGMRTFDVDGSQIEINGQPVFLRGTLECAIFPKTGFPPTDVASWERIFNICRAHGLNHMRFHSWCPPKAAFIAADQAGFYLQVEVSSWANTSTSLGDGAPIDRYIYEESERMVEEYGNHPSFCMLTYGNEPRGENQKEFLGHFVTYWKNKDARRIYASASGWPNLDVNDYLSDPNPRIQRWGEGVNSIINAQAPQTDYDWSGYSASFSQPVVSHEIGQWCVYPNFREIKKYDGVMRARNFEIFQETLAANGMENLADSFLLASGKLQALCYKADIEAALRTPGFGGFQLLDLHDFPGQGTALVGVLDAFWDEKGYITPEEYSHFCNSTVPLARLKKRIFTNDETFTAAIEVAHFGAEEWKGCTPQWQILDEANEIITSGDLAKTDIPLGNAIELGAVNFSLGEIEKAQRLTLNVEVEQFSNSWDFWVYPKQQERIENGSSILVTQKFNEQTMKHLQDGGSVLFNIKKGELNPEMGGKVEIGFSSIFWNTAWTMGQAPHTLGILCDPNHPALSEFPTEFYSNWQWWDAMSHSGAVEINTFPANLKPIVRVIDDWFSNRPLALIFEAKVGHGKILVSGIDLESDVSNRPEAQQLLYSLKKYMANPGFNPQVELKPDQIGMLIKGKV